MGAFGKWSDERGQRCPNCDTWDNWQGETQRRAWPAVICIFIRPQKTLHLFPRVAAWSVSGSCLISLETWDESYESEPSSSNLVHRQLDGGGAWVVARPSHCLKSKKRRGERAARMTHTTSPSLDWLTPSGGVCGQKRVTSMVAGISQRK